MILNCAIIDEDPEALQLLEQVYRKNSDPAFDRSLQKVR